MIAQETIQTIVDHIREKAKPSAMYLFGSYAYGTPHENSDLDLVVIKNIVQNKREELYSIINDLFSSDYSLDVLLFSEAEFEQKRKEGWLIIREILEKGVNLNVG